MKQIKIFMIVGILLLVISITSAFFWNPFKQISREEWPSMSYGERGYGSGAMGEVHGDIVESFEKEEVSSAEKDALVFAINEEYKARAMYTNMLEQLGDFMPTEHIILAEESHINLLIDLFEKYNLEIPEDSWKYSVEYSNYSEACKAGEEAEILNMDFYNGMYENVDNKDIYEVFSLLQWGSSMHLRAFQMCGGQGRMSSGKMRNSRKY